MSATLTPNITVGAAVALSVGGSMMFVKNGKLDRAAVLVKVTNARSGGFQQFKAGIRGIQMTFAVVYNGDAPPIGCVEGAEVTVIFDSIGYLASDNLGPNPSSTPVGRLITAQFIISLVSDGWEVEGDYGVDVTASSTGVYTVVDTATGATPIT